MKKIYIILILCFCYSIATAQKGIKEIYEGNQAYIKGDLKAAVKAYQEALALAPGNEVASNNLAVAQSKLKESKKAVENFDKAISESKKNTPLTARLNYDKGVTLAKDKKYQKAIEAFKNTLRINPENAHARDNLQKAINELKKQQQKNKPKPKKDKQQKKDNKQQPPKPNKQQQQKQPSKMTKEQAEKLLKALRNQEQETQKKLQKKAAGTPPPSGKGW